MPLFTAVVGELPESWLSLVIDLGGIATCLHPALSIDVE